MAIIDTTGRSGDVLDQVRAAVDENIQTVLDARNRFIRFGPPQFFREARPPSRRDERTPFLDSKIPIVGDKEDETPAGSDKERCDCCSEFRRRSRCYRAKKTEVVTTIFDGVVDAVGVNGQRTALWFHNATSGAIALAWENFTSCSTPDFRIEADETLRLTWEDWGSVIQSQWYIEANSQPGIVAITEVFCR